MVLAVGGNTDIVPPADQVIVSVVERDLLRDRGFFLFSQLRDVELVSKSPGESHVSAGLKAGTAPDQVVRRHGDVRAHGREGIEQRRALLDRKTLDGICIIRAPDLRAVIEHPRIKAGTSGGAVLQKKIREIRDQSILHLIQSQHIAVAELVLVLSA